MTRDIVDAVTSRAAINLTPGRQALAASQIAARFDDAERVVFGALAAEVEHEARRAVALGRSRVKPTGAYGDEAGDADIAVDATLAVFDSLLSGYERSHGPDTDAGSAARALRTRLLPRGLAAIAQAAYPDELAQIKSLLDDATNADVAEQLERIPGLSAVLTDLDVRAKRLRDALDRKRHEGASYRDVVAATSRAEDRLAELVGGIVFHHRGDAPAAVARRRLLLEPYAAQVNAMRERFRRRLPAGDVDPETGDEVLETLSPSPA